MALLSLVVAMECFDKAGREHHPVGSKNFWIFMASVISFGIFLGLSIMQIGRL